MTAADCLFCRIVAREIPAKIVFEDDRAVAFEDVSPQAPTHLLVIPRQHVDSLAALGEETALLGHLTGVLNRLAKARGLAASGYRVVVNNGPDANQTVGHLHLHLLGGRKFSWPPG